MLPNKKPSVYITYTVEPPGCAGSISVKDLQQRLLVPSFELGKKGPMVVSLGNFWAELHSGNRT